MDREGPMPGAKGDRIAPLLKLLAEALDARSSSGQSQEGAALVELGQLARLQIPMRGVLASDDQLFNAIDHVAIQHLDLTSARQMLDEALAGVDRVRRDLQSRRRHFFNKRVSIVNYVSPEMVRRRCGQ